MGRLTRENGAWTIDGQAVGNRPVALQVGWEVALRGCLDGEVFVTPVYQPRRYNAERCDHCGWMILDRETGEAIDLSAHLPLPFDLADRPLEDPTPAGEPSVWNPGPGDVFRAELALLMRQRLEGPNLEIHLTLSMRESASFQIVEDDR